MFGRSKETKDVNPVKLFADDLSHVVAAAKARHVYLSVIISELETTAAALKRQAVFSGNLPR